MDAALTPLAVIPSPTQGVWEIGTVPLRAYALCIVLGIVAACFIADRRLRHRGAPPWVILDIAVWAVPAGIIGARLYHVITSPEAYFGENGDLIKAFKIWEGGLGIWGGIAGGAVGAYIACRRMNLPFAMAADTLAVGLPVAQALGRWGNWFNNELYGKATDLPWALKVYTWDAKAGHAQMVNGEPMELGTFHPTFLYEFLWCLGVAAVVWYVDKRWSLGRGRAFALYVALYCAGRFWIEALRIDDAHHFLGMRLNNWTSLIVLAAALVYFLRVRGPQERVTYDENGRITPVAGEPSAALAPASSDVSDSSEGSDSSDAAESSEGPSLVKSDTSDSSDTVGDEEPEAGDADDPSDSASDSASDSSSASTSGKG
ncbi:prolipoprotein diacylglyceryl transferase [Dactylosporangium sp. CA-152071]|uniref:prolipoprotein diacylglyceryl transferase n=1 Tax=Dactylosporangium sp. CA-152071 TaxID=3239933 RepID=UPI003D8F2D04